MAPWLAAAAILLLPLVAMQFTDGVRWDAADFIIAGTMLAVACGTWELAARMSGSGAYRAAVGIAVGAALVLVWLNLAVGIIGTEENPANVMFGGVLAVGLTGAVVARFRSAGMARALVATAFAQMLVAGIAIAAGMDRAGDSPAGEILGISALFAGAWLASAWLFRKAARERRGAGAVP